VLGVEDGTAVDAESDTIDLGGALLGSALVLDSELGLVGLEERVIGLALVVLGLLNQPGSKIIR
jgi:hypothetical protein